MAVEGGGTELRGKALVKGNAPERNLLSQLREGQVESDSGFLS